MMVKYAVKKWGKGGSYRTRSVSESNSVKMYRQWSSYGQKCLDNGQMMVKYTELGARGSDRTRSVPESVSESNNGQNFQSWSNTRSNTRSRSRSRAAPTAPGDLNWSNNGQILVIYRSSNGRVTVEYQFDTVQTRVKDWSNNMFKLVKTMAKDWSNNGQGLVKQGSKTGQITCSNWSKLL